MVDLPVTTPGKEANHRILVLGSSGSGKTTLARRLGQIMNLEVIHLDSYFWLPNWQPSRRDDWEKKIGALLAKDSWVMDGNYLRSLAKRLERANLVILLDFPRWKCLYRCIKRLLQNWGRTRHELAQGCREKMDWDFLQWVWSYPEVVRPDILAHLGNLPPETDVILLNSDTEVADFLISVRKCGRSPRITGRWSVYGA